MTSHGEILRKQRRWFAFSVCLRDKSKGVCVGAKKVNNNKSDWTGELKGRGGTKGARRRTRKTNAETMPQGRQIEKRQPFGPRRKATQTPEAARANIMSCANKQTHTHNHTHQQNSHKSLHTVRKPSDCKVLGQKCGHSWGSRPSPQRSQ